MAVETKPVFISIQNEEDAKEIRKISAEKNCSLMDAMKIWIIRKGIPQTQSQTSEVQKLNEQLEKERLIEEIRASVYPNQQSGKGPGISSFEQVRMEEDKIRQRVLAEQEIEKAKVEREVAERIKIMLPNQGQNKPEMTEYQKKLDELGVKAITDAIAGTGNKNMLNADNLPALFDGVSKISHEFVGVLENANRRNNQKDIFLGVGHLLSVCKAAGLNPTLGDVVRIIELAAGQTNPAPASEKMTKDDAVAEMERQLKLSLEQKKKEEEQQQNPPEKLVFPPKPLNPPLTPPFDEDSIDDVK